MIPSFCEERGRQQGLSSSACETRLGMLKWENHACLSIGSPKRLWWWRQAHTVLGSSVPPCQLSVSSVRHIVGSGTAVPPVSRPPSVCPSGPEIALPTYTTHLLVERNWLEMAESKAVTAKTHPCFLASPLSPRLIRCDSRGPSHRAAAASSGSAGGLRVGDR